MSFLEFKGLKIKISTKYLCVKFDCTRTPVPISLGKIITNNFGASLKESLTPSSFATAFNFFQAKSSLNCGISYEDFTVEKT